MSRRIMIAASALMALWAGTVSAQSPPSYDADKAAAEQLFTEGRRLMERGDYAAACRKLKASFDVDPVTGTQLNLADCYVKIGRLASAWGHYRDAAVRAGKENRPDRERYARTRAVALEPRLPRLRIDMDEAAQVPGLVIERDGERVSLELLGSAVYVDPGEHEITALAPGFAPFSRKVQAVEGKASAVAIPRFVRSARTAEDAQRARGRETVSAAATKNAVFIVRPHYHDAMRLLFKGLSDVMSAAARDASSTEQAAALAELARLYLAHANSPGHGSGFLIMGEDGLPWVVTNKHVAGQAEYVTLDWAVQNYRPIERCHVLYVDPDVDLAIISVPPGSLPPGAVGFELSYEPVEEGLAVAAAGFPGVPGYQNRPVFQYTEGIVNNAEFPLPGGATAIQHSAEIASGNSGGPMLIKDPGAALGYRVIGVNTWVVKGRTNVNLAIPVKAVAAALQKARVAYRLHQDPVRLAAALRSNAARLAQELGSVSRDEEALYEMISYEWVARRGEELVAIIFQSLDEMSPEQQEFFLTNPVEYMRRLMFVTFLGNYTPQELAGVQLEQIYEQDLEQLGVRGSVRSVYSISGTREEVSWVFEHGAWKISDATFTRAARTQTGQTGQTARTSSTARTGQTADMTQTATVSGTTPVPGFTRKRGLAVAVAAGLGPRTAEGDLMTGGFEPTDATGPAFLLTMDIPLGRYLGFRLGAGYVNKGVVFNFVNEGMSFKVDESVYYVQVPATLRLEIPLESDSVTLRPRIAAGVAGNLLVKEGGTGTSDAGTVDLGSEWYEGHSQYNVSLLLGGGLDIGFGRRPGVFFGMDVVRDTHLLSEWSSTAWAGENSKYRAWYIGGNLTFQLYR